MSHFAVLVIGDDVEKQLAPYQENNMGDCPKQFLQFVEDADHDVDDETGKRGYWENPNRKWDWWVIGGRYAMRLKVKPGAWGHCEPAKSYDDELRQEQRKTPSEFVDQARVGDIDWEGMRADRLTQRQKSWAEWEASGADPARGYFLFGIEKGMTREQYLAQAEEFSVFAVVKDGKWYERGEMGWFATVSNEKDEALWRGELKALMEGLSDDTLLTIVDCHI